jgi:hypothetical protein
VRRELPPREQVELVELDRVSDEAEDGAGQSPRAASLREAVSNSKPARVCRLPSGSPT